MSAIVGPHLVLALAQRPCGCLLFSINVLLLIELLIGQQEDLKNTAMWVCVGITLLSKRSNEYFKPPNYLFKALVKEQVVIVQSNFSDTTKSFCNRGLYFHSNMESRGSNSEFAPHFVRLLMAFANCFWLSGWCCPIFFCQMQNAKRLPLEC